MGAQFTPGPWIVNPFVARVDCQTISEKGGLLPVCQMLWPTEERTEAETEANAHMIAAAPELYEALAELVRIYGGNTPAWVVAQDALTKARGEAS